MHVVVFLNADLVNSLFKTLLVAQTTWGYF